MVETAGEIAVALAAADGLLPQRRPRNGGKPLHEARWHCRSAPALGRSSEEDFGGAEKLGEVMGREPDASLRQIEAERLAHRPAQPGIGGRRGRPYALHQGADDDAVDAVSRASSGP